MWWLVLLALVVGIVLGAVYVKWTAPKPVAPIYAAEPVKYEPLPVADAPPVAPEFFYHPITRRPERRV